MTDEKQTPKPVATVRHFLTGLTASAAVAKQTLFPVPQEFLSVLIKLQESPDGDFETYIKIGQQLDANSARYTVDTDPERR